MFFHTNIFKNIYRNKYLLFTTDNVPWLIIEGLNELSSPTEKLTNQLGNSMWYEFVFRVYSTNWTT